MKALTFNQLQIRIFFIIFVLFTSIVISYRMYIERPQLEQSIAQLVKKELQILSYAAKNYIHSINSVNYDYAVWDQSYNFVENKYSDNNEQYIHENFMDDIFVNLKIDGIFIFSENLESIFVKGYHHIKDERLIFDFYDFERNPLNKNIFPLRIDNKKVAQGSGMINTRHGPALFTVTEIKRTDRTGDGKGFMMFLKLFDQSIIDEIEQYTMTKITTFPITELNDKLAIDNWNDEVNIAKITKQSQRYIRDIHQQPLLLITMEHANGEIPPLLDKQSFIFISLFTFIIFIVYSLMSYIIIRPVKLLANQIKRIDENESLVFLDESYQIDELDSVSQHFNALMTTINHQKALLSQQAFTDTLTNITNRRGFEQHLEQQCQLFIRQKIGFTVIIADVDHFKRFNDSLGHIAGDEALIKVAKVLNEHFKRTNDLCARYGGEEFIMLYSDITHQQLDKKSQEILAAFTKLNLSHPDSPTSKHVTISIGACIVTASDSTTKVLSPKTVIRAADYALYKAKNEGRNRAISINLDDYIHDDFMKMKHDF